MGATGTVVVDGDCVAILSVATGVWSDSEAAFASPGVDAGLAGVSPPAQAAAPTSNSAPSAAMVVVFRTNCVRHA